MEIKVEKEDAENFVEDLIKKITETGLYAMSKTDFYDYVLYLLDKHSENHFLSDNTNFENALLLKIPESRVKSLKLNIDLKFREESEKDSLVVITNFLSKLSESNFISDENKNRYIFVLDDKYTRMCIESVLKKSGTTLDYSFNSERVSLEKESLCAFLKQYSEDLEKHLSYKQAADDIKQICTDLVEKYVPAGILITRLPNIAETVIQKLHK